MTKVVKGKKVVFDATFIKAHSKREIRNNCRGGSDPEARVGRNSKTYPLGYKLHLAVDAKSELPLAVTLAPANDNEKKHAPKLFKKALKATRKNVNSWLRIRGTLAAAKESRTQKRGFERLFLILLTRCAAKGGC